MVVLSMAVLAGCSGSSSSGGSTPGRPAAPAPAPVLASVTPSSMIAGSAPFTLIVDGSSFTASSVVLWNGAARPTTYVSAKELTAAVSAADVSAAGTEQVTVSTPAPGGGTSSAVPFTVSAASEGQSVGIIAALAVNGSGQPGNGATFAPAMSADGRYVAFNSLASNLVSDDTNDAPDVFVEDTCQGASAPAGCTPSIQRVSLDFSDKQLPSGVVANYPIPPESAISGDGRFIVFLAQVGDLIPSGGVPTDTEELFLRDTCIGQPATCVPSTTLVSQDGSRLHWMGRPPTPRAT